MDIAEFVKLSFGKWRSQRSAHNLAFSHFEQVISTIDIVPLSSEDPAVIALCESYKIEPKLAIHPFRMSWEGESDWEEGEIIKGTTILVPISDPNDPKKGQLLRDQGYAETIPSVGNYHFNEEGCFILITPYDRAMAEERIWFGTPNLRFRVSLIKTSAGTGVVTASFASEIRCLDKE
ncbi:putative phycoerythrin-associated linker protein, CpeS (plasmid) [Gloeothece citriformis PCC 7424]|uniref:Chromophore lyase CpcS/CpeS n=1 Tax=Gloeothece citriformis (strain PCC 7424) TaxID=65393 RepID=B7KLW6_GLOC7|nr:phycobiliprotein lyase [Gloeothece citriformis]ACK73788.1 putative phycoerythrin-associated linker protein, CpeS [Gloeothece citriformis PCC 7424]